MFGAGCARTAVAPISKTSVAALTLDVNLIFIGISIWFCRVRYALSIHDDRAAPLNRNASSSKRK